MEKLKKDILSLLQEDARQSAEQMAVMLGKKEEEVKIAIEEMEIDGIIVKYNALVNYDKLDEECVQALIEVKVTPQRNRGFDAIAEDIFRFKEVKSLYLMSGGFDLAVFVEGKSIKEVAMFVSERLSLLDTVISTATHFILKKYKVEGTIMDEKEKKRLAIKL